MFIYDSLEVVKAKKAEFSVCRVSLKGVPVGRFQTQKDLWTLVTRLKPLTVLVVEFLLVGQVLYKIYNEMALSVRWIHATN